MREEEVSLKALLIYRRGRRGKQGKAIYLGKE